MFRLSTLLLQGSRRLLWTAGTLEAYLRKIVVIFCHWKIVKSQWRIMEKKWWSYLDVLKSPHMESMFDSVSGLFRWIWEWICGFNLLIPTSFCVQTSSVVHSNYSPVKKSISSKLRLVNPFGLSCTTSTCNTPCAIDCKPVSTCMFLNLFVHTFYRGYLYVLKSPPINLLDPAMSTWHRIIIISTSSFIYIYQLINIINHSTNHRSTFHFPHSSDWVNISFVWTHP